MSKKNILIFIDWFLPAFKAGGPIQSVYNLTDRLKNEYDFFVVTSDKDLGDDQPLEGVLLNKWTTFKKINVIYLTKENQRIGEFKKILQKEPYHAVYFNSMFSIKFTIIPLLAALKLDKKIVIAPRGMLGAGALKLGYYKKMIFLQFFKLLNIHKKVVWQATAKSEFDEIVHVFGKRLSIKIASNLSKSPAKLNYKRPKLNNEVNLFFLSRISKKKNLLVVLEYLDLVNDNFKVNLKVIGPIEDESYWLKCKERIKSFSHNISVSYIGSIPNSEVNAELHDQHFMILPTLNENFGHVIIESWQNGCPVIISDQTPWRNLEKSTVGWDIALTNRQDFINTIERTASMTEEEFSLWSESSFKFAQKVTSDSQVIQDSIDLFSFEA